MSDLLRFLWIAFREYWGVWVTGTGLVGLLLWAINFFQGITGHPLKRRTQVFILFATFWFLATFSAWHDSERNLQNVVLARANDTGNLGSCIAQKALLSGDIRALEGELRGKQGVIESKDQLIAALQAPLAGNQASLNSCVVALGKANQKPTLKLQLKVLPMSPGLYVILGTTNLAVMATGKLSCAGSFDQFSARLAQDASHQSISVNGNTRHVSPNEARIEITAPSWTPETPLLLLAQAAHDFGPCEMKLD
jgi:hypothetical protein